MAVYNAWTVEFRSPTGALGWTSLSNVQDLSCQVGRQLPTDQWRPSSASIRMRYPTGFASPPTGLTINSQIRFFAPGRASDKPTWTGYVRDMTVQVGLPWVSATSTANADFLVLECEGALATTSRQKAVVQTTATATKSLKDQIQTYFFPYAAANNFVGISGSTDVQALTGTFFINESLNTDDIFQRFNGTYQMRMLDGVRKSWTSIDPTKIESYGVDDCPSMFLNTNVIATADVATVAFSDTTNNATNRLYDTFDFDSLSDNYFTTSTLDTPGGYQYSGSSSTTVDRDVNNIGVQEWNVVGGSVTTPTGPNYAQAAADWWANAFSNAEISPSSISATTNGQHTQNLDTLGFSNLELGYLPSKAVRITLRGNTYLCRIEGVAVTADTNQARFTYYLSPTADTAWFILDDADFGVLDQNRLGIY